MPTGGARCRQIAEVEPRRELGCLRLHGGSYLSLTLLAEGAKVWREGVLFAPPGLKRITPGAMKEWTAWLWSVARLDHFLND